MICFAAFTPHSPLLIESIGKEHTKQLAQTHAALVHLSDELYASFPDTILIISSHHQMYEQAFSINLHDTYEVNFRNFGDLSITKKFQPDFELISAIQREARGQTISFVLESFSVLDYGAGVPLLLLCQDCLHTRIVPITYSAQDRKTHLAFGRLLQHVIQTSHKRVAVIASGDLSHCLSSEAPLGFHKEGALFDEMIKQSIEQQSTTHLLMFNEEDLNIAGECAFRSLLILFGLLERINTRPEILSYEFPFGVGYLVAQFHL